MKPGAHWVTLAPYRIKKIEREVQRCKTMMFMTCSTSLAYVIFKEWNGGEYYSWTNKRVWSRIDRVFTNVLWFETMDYTQPHYLPSSLSNHNPLLIQSSSSPRPQPRVQFCDIWIKHKDFSQIIASTSPASASLPKLQQIKSYMDKLRPKLMKLNRHHYADLRAQ